jgi:uncharacterized integral membrane protein
MRDSTAAIAGLGLPEEYYCKKCGYQGSIILEVDRKSWRKGKYTFRTRPYVPPKLWDKKTVELAKPVFSVMMLLFFAVLVLLVIPMSKVENPVIKQIGSYQVIPTLDGEKVPLVLGSTLATPLNYPTLPLFSKEIAGLTNTYWTAGGNATMSPLERAIGINVLGFVFPLFITFFMIGILAILIYSHLHRATHFL